MFSPRNISERWRSALHAVVWAAVVTLSLAARGDEGTDASNLEVPKEATDAERQPPQASADTLSPDQRAQLQEAQPHRKRIFELLQGGDLQGAARTLETVVAIEQRVLGHHRQVLESLQLLAEMYLRNEDFAAAKSTYRRCLRLQHHLHGPQHWHVTDTRLEISRIARLAELNPEQREKHREMHRLHQETQRWSQQGYFQRAIQSSQQALEIHVQLFGKNDAGYATKLNDLALLYRSGGQYAEAARLYQVALSVHQAVRGENHPEYANTMNNLGVVYSRQGAYPQAEPLLRGALALRGELLGEEDPAYATSLSNLGVLYHGMGDYGRATSAFQQAVGVYRTLDEQEFGFDHARMLNNLAESYRARAMPEAARQAYQEALDVYQAVVGRKHPEFATTLNNLGALHMDLGDYERAKHLFREVQEIRRDALGVEHGEYAASLNNLAEAKSAMGDHAQAEPLFQEAMRIWAEVLGRQHPSYATGLQNLAVHYWTMGDYGEAEPLAREAIEILREHLDVTFVIQSERQQLQMTDKLRKNLDLYLSVAPRAERSRGDAYQHVLAWKGAVFGSQAQSRLMRSEPGLAPLFQELQRVSSQLAARVFAAAEPEQRRLWQQQIEQLAEEREALERELARRSIAFRSQQDLARLTADQLSAVLPAETALVDLLEYTHFSPPADGKGRLSSQRRLAAFVVRADRPVEWIDLGPVEPLEEVIARWRVGYGWEHAEPHEETAGQELRRRIWEPLVAHLEGATTVLVSPDGAISRVPFGALPGKDEETYLIEEVALAVIAVPQLLPALIQTDAVADVEHEPPSLLLVGDVDYGGRPGPAEDPVAHRSVSIATQSDAGLTFQPLAHTGTEVAAVRDSFVSRFEQGRVRILDRDLATESAFRTHAPGYRWLHLATHGFFAPEHFQSALQTETGGAASAGQTSGFHPGLLSGIALTGANARPQLDEDDGILTALEVAALDLSNVDVVVLSACETGLGDVAGGEGLLGLQRAFQVAGARTTVASLWEVPDLHTMRLMDRFYANLWNRGMPKLEALREAQIWLMREGSHQPVQHALRDQQEDAVRGLRRLYDQPPDARRLPPFYWAAFLLSGDWR